MIKKIKLIRKSFWIGNNIQTYYLRMIVLAGLLFAPLAPIGLIAFSLIPYNISFQMALTNSLNLQNMPLLKLKIEKVTILLMQYVIWLVSIIILIWGDYNLFITLCHITLIILTIPNRKYIQQGLDLNKKNQDEVNKTN